MTGRTAVAAAVMLNEMPRKEEGKNKIQIDKTTLSLWVKLNERKDGLEKIWIFFGNSKYITFLLLLLMIMMLLYVLGLVKLESCLLSVCVWVGILMRIFFLWEREMQKQKKKKRSFFTLFFDRRSGGGERERKKKRRMMRDRTEQKKEGNGSVRLLGMMMEKLRREKETLVFFFMRVCCLCLLTLSMFKELKHIVQVVISMCMCLRNHSWKLMLENISITLYHYYYYV